MHITNREGLTSLSSFTFFPFPFSKAYADFIKQQFGNEVIYFEKNNIVVPLEVIGRKFFQQIKLLAPPFRYKKEIAVDELKSYLNDLHRALKKTGNFMRIIQPHPIAFTAETPSDSNYCAFGTYITSLQNKSDEDLLNSFDIKYKKAVQHSIKNGGNVIIDNNCIDRFYAVYNNTCKRANIYCDSLNYFNNLNYHLPYNTIASIINDAEGVTIGAAFFIFDEHACYCTHAGSIPGSNLYGGMKHLHYEVMKWMRDKNVKSYDLTGVRINSSNETLQGIFKFKKGFGGELKQGYLWKSDLNKLKCITYDTLLALKTKGKKHKDIIDQEL